MQVLAAPPLTAPTVGLPLGKRIEPGRTLPTDWSRVGVGGDLPRCGSTLSGMELEPDERYRTTNGERIHKFELFSQQLL